MADLAIGLSKKVVDGLVNKVEDAVKEEQELWLIVERDSLFIKDEFEMMKSFLNTADRDRVRNHVVRTWVRQVRDLSYDAEDCMDDVLELEPKRPWWALSFWQRMLPPGCRPRVGNALDEAVEKIKLIKARVEEVSHRNLRYNLINNTSAGGSSQQMQQAAAAMDLDLDLLQEGTLRLRWLLDYGGRQRRLISVWGTGGNHLGTISIIRNVFDNPAVRKVNKCRAWVKLMHPFSPQKFLGDLVAQLLTNSSSSGAICGADVMSKTLAHSVDLAKLVQKLLKDGSYLIVLEDLSSMAEWDTIRTYLPDEQTGSRVVVSTQHRETARLCIGQTHYVQELGQFSADHYVYAFFEEICMTSQQKGSSTYVASLSAAANYWDYQSRIIGYGRYEEVGQLYGRISGSSRSGSHVVTVLGAPGTGKDAVVTKVCSQLLLLFSTTPSFELYGWVDVSSNNGNPFSARGFAQSLLSVLRPDSSPSSSKRPAIDECSRLLSQHRCLVVINGMQRTEDCLALAKAGLIYHSLQRSCIVVVTTEESVARYWRNTTSSAAVCNMKSMEPSSGDQDGSMGGSSFQLHDFTSYWCGYYLPGRDEELSQLYNMISSRGNQNSNIDATHVVTVWAPPVVGDEKRSLVAKVYSYCVATGRPSFQLYGWAKVSSDPNSPLSLEGFSQSLLSYMRPQLQDSLPLDETDNPIQDCLNLLTNNRCLVVIDGLQSMEDCDKLINARLIYGNPKSCIILITAKESVATFWKKTTPHAVYTLEPLDVQQQGQLSTLRDNTLLLFKMANRCPQQYFPIIGRDDEVGRLSSKILSSSGQNGMTRVIVVWGPPGVGKTAIVREVYSQCVHTRLSARSFDLFGWVRVPNPFNLMGFSRVLLSTLRPQSPQSADPIRDCSNLVRIRSCLVVIEGLECMENFCELANAGFIFGNPKGCAVLITTVDKSVTTCIPVADGIFKVEPLDRLSARMLFKQVYEQRRNFNSDYYLVADKCCGLPIVIVAVAKYLSSVSEDAVGRFTAIVKDGSKFIHELETNRPEPQFAGLKRLIAWVDSDLKACRQSLKLFVMYMLNFTQEAIVRRKRLVWRWIAEGYVKNTGICEMVTEAQQRLQELEELAMMMMHVPAGPGGRSDNTWHRGYQLSGFSAEVLMSRAAEEPIFLPLEVSALTEGKWHRHSRRGCVGRHLRVDAEWKREEFEFRSLDLSRLRSLTVSGSFEAFFINDSMKVLRVLDLEDAKDIENDDLNEIHKLLPRLRFLSLRGCTEISLLPDSIGNLRQLQTLDIRRTKITRLPNSILKLRNLKCLRAGHTMKALAKGGPDTPWRRRISSRLRGLASCSCQTTQKCYGSQGVTMPRGISQLTALHTLGIVNVNTAGGEAILEELRNLKQLRKVELSGINSCNVRGLRRLPNNLESLSLEFTFTRDRGGFALRSSFCSGLSRDVRLKLHGHVGSLQALPPGIRVTDLTLEIDASLTEDHMKLIGELPMVRTLRLHFHPRQEGRYDKLKFYANDGNYFPKLEVLEITSLDSTTPLDVGFASGALETLEVLKFVGLLRIIPRGLRDLCSLKEVWVEEDQGLLRTAVDKAFVGYPNKPAVIDFKSFLQYTHDPEIVDDPEIV